MSLRWFGAMVFVVMGCSASSDDASDGSDPNRCETSDDCQQGRCVDGVCLLQVGRITTAMLEITPPTSVSSDEYSGMRFLAWVRLDESNRLDVELPRVARLEVGMQAPQPDCDADVDSGDRLAVRVEAVQHAGLRGLSAESFAASSDPGASSNRATVRLPPGDLDLYVQPLDNETLFVDTPDDCTVAPLLVRRARIEAGTVSWTQRFPKATRLEIDVRVPVGEVEQKGQSLNGWTADVLDSVGGRRISTRYTLQEPQRDEQGIDHYPVTLAFNPVAGEAADQLLGTELVRLSPPDNRVAPVFLVERSTLDLFGTGQGILDQITRIPTEVTIKGRVEAADDAAPVPSQVTLIAAEPEGAVTGVWFSFRATADTDESGNFTLPAVAGAYQVFAVPTDDREHGLLATKWSVTPTPSEQAGKLLSLPLASSIKGVVVGPADTSSVEGSTVHAIPSQAGRTTRYVDSLFGRGAALSPRSASGFVDEAGAFTLLTDAGNFHVSIRPPQSSAHPWALRPNTEVGAGVTGIGNIRISVPAAYRGKVTVPGLDDAATRLPLPSALIRVHALLDADGRVTNDAGLATSAVVVGESRADEEGTFEVLLPEGLE